jgi:hypothetical protein
MNERCMCGATDCPRCYPGRTSEPTSRDYELALDEIVETVLDYGMYPHPTKGVFTKSKFDLYDFLNDNRDPSYFLEMYIGAITGNDLYDRVDRERKTIKEMLEKHFKGSEIVADLATEYAGEE